MHSTGGVGLGAVFFCSFMMFGAMIVLNLFIGVIMSGMEQAEAEVVREELEEAKHTGGPTKDQKLEKLAQQLSAIQKELHQIALIEDKSQSCSRRRWY